ncbi:hypothetical protein NHG95_28110 [Pseudomonas corrugata]|uniref:hypothetical protein n=1 Tax=Pseudomonas corrugata TaxID=47879 RepID=UPI0028C3C03D|nr:hypothetical protein [Pseudomonas corrugata]MDU9037002.1 hypothetical protein [Pseudomonas corrugata]
MKATVLSTPELPRGPGGRGGESLTIEELTKRQHHREVLRDQELGRKSRTYLEFLESKGLLGLKARIERESSEGSH